MAAFLHDCPHCTGKSASFTLRAGYSRSILGFIDRVGDVRVHEMLAACGVCQGPLIVQVNVPVHLHYNVNEIAQADVLDPNDFFLRRILPAPAPQSLPSHTPTNIARFYQQAETSLQSRQWDASGSMSRKTLDTTTKYLVRQVDQNHAIPANLGPRID